MKVNIDATLTIDSRLLSKLLNTSRTPSTRLPRKFDAARAVKLYMGGMTNLTDLAERMGYPRGNGQNRIRYTLIKAGVFGKKLSA